MRISVQINGTERGITVSVVREDRIIYIPKDMFDLFENELSDPDGIQVFSS